MDLLNKKFLTITIPDTIDNHSVNCTEIQTSTKFNKVNFCIEIHEIISKYKQFIDDYYDDWDKYKFYTNLFELLNYLPKSFL